MPSPAAPTLPRILLVEDHDMTRRMQIRFLSRSYAVDFASTGEEAIELARERSYEAIVVDIGLAGGLTGLDVMQMLKQVPAHRGTAMVAVTGYAADGDRERLTSAGFDLYLAKPFRWQEFTDVIHLAVRLTAEGAVQAPPARLRTPGNSAAPARSAFPSIGRMAEAIAPARGAASGDGLAGEATVRPTVRLRPGPPAELARPGSSLPGISLLGWQPLAAL